MKHNSLWHVNKPHRKDMRLYSQWKKFSDIAAMGWLEVTAPWCPKISGLCGFKNNVSVVGYLKVRWVAQ